MANLSEAKEFNKGGMDQDSAPQYVQPNDYLDAVNMRFTGTKEGEDGDGVEIESNRLISAPRRSGINVQVGSEKFEALAKAYSINYNSQGYHTICELDKETGIESVIFEDITDTGGVQLLNLDPQYIIGDIKILHKKFLLFTDGNASIKCINLERLKSGSFGVVRKEDINLIKAQPFRVPIYNYGDDAGRSANLMRGRLFQFREQFEYLDYELSTWGTISKRNVPFDEPSPTASSQVAKNNHVVISVDAGTDRVVKLNIAGRYGIMDWFLVKTIEREYVVKLPNKSVDVLQEIYEAYDSATNLYSFVFYNDGLYSNIDVLETDEPYDSVPDTAESLEIINGSIVALAGIKEGKERPTTDFDFSVSYYDPQIKAVPTDQTNALRVSATSNKRFSGSHQRGITVSFAGKPKVGDIINIVTADIRNAASKMEHKHTVTLAEQDNLNLLMQNYHGEITEEGWFLPTMIYFITPGFFALESATVTLANVSLGTTKSISALKTNSSYQAAVRYYDENGKYFPLLTGRDFVVNTKSFAQTKGLLPQINWNIVDEKAPAGAVGYQILLSENTTHKSSLYVVAKSAQTSGNYVEIIVNSLQDFNTRNPSSILNYGYTEGDRVTFVLYSLTQLPNSDFYFNLPPIDVQVLGFEVRVTGDDTNKVTDYVLRVAKSSQFLPEAFTNANVLIEIYTPKNRVLTDADGNTTAAENLFFEIGEQYAIKNGVHTVLSGVIKEGDSYYKNREYVLATNNQVLRQYMVEDFNFSDYYKSDYHSAGRPATYFDEPGVVERGASIRTSEPSVIGSKTNGVNRFYASRIYGDGDGETSINYGKIKKIIMRDTFLICIQEVKVAHVPVFKSYLADLAERQNVAISDKLFNNAVYPPSGTYGIGRAKESFAQSEKGTVYFIDPNNSVPVRDGYDGIRPLAEKMGNFFRRFLKNAYDSGAKIHGMFDDANREYIVSVQSAEGVVSSFAFTEGTVRYKEAYKINTLTLAPESTSHGTLNINKTTGSATFTPEPNYTGPASFAFSFIVNGSKVVKNKCFNVVPANLSIKTFHFDPVYNADTSAEYISGSILIEGNQNPVPISVTGGSYSINGGAWQTAAGMVSSGNTVRVRLNTGSAFQAANNAVLTVNGYAATFAVTTKENPVAASFIWLSIEHTGALFVPADQKTYETIVVRAYKGIDPTIEPALIPTNRVSIVMQDIKVEKHSLQNTQFKEVMTVDMGNVSEVTVVPLPGSDVSHTPRHLTKDANADYYFTFPNLSEGELLNITNTDT